MSEQLAQLQADYDQAERELGAAEEALGYAMDTVHRLTVELRELRAGK